MNDHIAISLIVPACDDRPQEEPDMDDPLVIALAQLVRDRWHNEQRKRARLTVLPPTGDSKAVDRQIREERKSA
jgi:hypothetical protein